MNRQPEVFEVAITKYAYVAINSDSIISIAQGYHSIASVNLARPVVLEVIHSPRRCQRCVRTAVG